MIDINRMHVRVPRYQYHVMNTEGQPCSARGVPAGEMRATFSKLLIQPRTEKRMYCTSSHLTLIFYMTWCHGFTYILIITRCNIDLVGCILARAARERYNRGTILHSTIPVVRPEESFR